MCLFIAWSLAWGAPADETKDSADEPGDASDNDGSDPPPKPPAEAPKVGE
jgi:hypothetical protein